MPEPSPRLTHQLTWKGVGGAGSSGRRRLGTARGDRPRGSGHRPHRATMGSRPGQPGRAVPWARGRTRRWGACRASCGRRWGNHCLGSRATHVAGEAGASSRPALHLGGMNGGEAEPHAQFRTPGRWDTRPRSEFGQEAGAVNTGQGAAGERSPALPAPRPRREPREASGPELSPRRPSRGSLPPRFRAPGSGSTRFWGGRERRRAARPGAPAAAGRARGQRGGEGSAGAGRRADGSGRAGSRAGAAAIACATFLQSWVSALGRPGGRTPRHGAPEPALRGKPLRQWEGLEGEVYIKERKICKCGTK